MMRRVGGGAGTGTDPVRGPDRLARRPRPAPAGGPARSLPLSPARPLPRPLGLTSRRHIDLLRVCSAG
ncbi:hypothetical protein GCM10010282_17560 [Streptomyces roseolus]|nr:hypothetical protein GCM10010282_17560 [Streptomyces roseolus]